MNNFKLRITNYKFLLPLLILVLIAASGCTKVDKPVRGEEGSSPMAIVIDGDPPESHTKALTSEGNKLVSPYTKVPVVGPLFKSSLEGLEYWKAFHPVFVTGTQDPQLIVATEDEEEMCLDCHDQNTSCNNCHSYVGVNLVTSSDE